MNPRPYKRKTDTLAIAIEIIVIAGVVVEIVAAIIENFK